MKSRLLPHLGISDQALLRSLALVFGCILTTASCAAKSAAWPTIPVEELTDGKPHLAPDAAAEIIEWKIEIGNWVREDPTRRTEYIRYKIYAPEKAEDVIRRRWQLSDRAGDCELSARLTLPNGKVQEFGREARKEQSLARGGKNGYFAWTEDTAYNLKEYFLLIPNVERGAILEYRMVMQETRWLNDVVLIPLQHGDIGVRNLEFTLIRFDRLLILHSLSGKKNETKKQNVISVSATDIPPAYDEPYPAPLADRFMLGLAVSSSISQPFEVNPTALNSTSRLEKLTFDLTRHAVSPWDKAAAIHRFVRDLFSKYTLRPEPKRPRRTDSLHELLDFEKSPNLTLDPDQFFVLELTLCKIAGIEAYAIHLANREIVRYEKTLSLPNLLNETAIAVKIGDKWVYSSPVNADPLPFDILPWQWEGATGRLLDKPGNLLDVPASSSSKSSISTTGTFAVDLAGTLTGECRRTYTGHTAIALRRELREVDAERRWSIAREKFGFDSRVVELTDIAVIDADNPDKPLILSTKVRWPGYATRTKERLVMRPTVFHAEAESPFPASERHNPVSFPYRWQEFDELTISIPEGFAPESPTMPKPNDGGILSQRIEFGYDAKHRVLHVKRTFKSEALDVPVKYYSALKAWYDEAMQCDRHEVVFRGSNVPLPGATVDQPAAPADTRTHDDTDDAPERGRRSTRHPED